MGLATSAACVIGLLVLWAYFMDYYLSKPLLLTQVAPNLPAVSPAESVSGAVCAALL